MSQPMYCGGPKQAKYWMEWLTHRPEVRVALGYTPSIHQITGGQVGIHGEPSWVEIEGRRIEVRSP